MDKIFGQLLPWSPPHPAVCVYEGKTWTYTHFRLSAPTPHTHAHTTTNRLNINTSGHKSPVTPDLYVLKGL